MVGINRITNDGVLFTRGEMMNILMYVPTFDGVPESSQASPERWTGRQLISIALPSGLNLDMKNSSYNDDSETSDTLNHVIIKDGQLVQGRIDSSIMNAGSRGLIHMIYNDYGHEVCQRFLDDIRTLSQDTSY